MPMISADPEGRVLIAIKAVPGAKRDEIVGPLGDRLKVRVSAPPEGGKANRAICELLAESLGLKPRDIEVIAGHASAEKSVRVIGIEPAAVERRLLK